MDLAGAVGEFYVVRYAPQLFNADLSALVPYDMPLLLSLVPALGTLTTGVMLPDWQGGGGGSFGLSISAVPALLGRTYLLQILTLDPLSGSGRLGEATPILFVP